MRGRKLVDGVCRSPTTAPVCLKLEAGLSWVRGAKLIGDSEEN
jgi:hypothetical protein